MGILLIKIKKFTDKLKKLFAKMTFRSNKVPSLFGYMKGTAETIGDIMAPLDEEWEKCTYDAENIFS